MKQEQHGTGADSKARSRMSVRDAVRWAVKISLACNGLLVLILMILGMIPEIGMRVDFPPDWLFPGDSVWNAVFGGPWHNMVWLFSSLALNFIIYSALIFIVEVVFMFWRRWLHPANTNFRIFP